MAIEGTFHVLEVLKGQVPPGGKVHTSIRGSVCVGLLPGNEFLVYLDSQNVIVPHRTRAMFGRYEDGHNQRGLKKLRELAKRTK